jgi:hypothetical protein
VISADQLLAHAVGDYVLQSDWMANEKRKDMVACWAHALSYTLPFLLLTLSPLALLCIAMSHFYIDHFALARYVVWAKNLPAPKRYRYSWADCQATGYHPDRPAFLAVWLLIIADNVMHVLCNGLAIAYAGSP